MRAPARLLMWLRQAALPLLLPGAIVLGGGRLLAAEPEQPVSYHKQIRPIFQAHCQG